MKKFLVYIVLLGLMINVGMVVSAKDNIQSTQGLVLEENISNTASMTDKEYKKEVRDKNKAKRKYLKNVSNIKKLREKKSIKQRDMNFYNKRLEQKKNKLEDLTNKKGD